MTLRGRQRKADSLCISNHKEITSDSPKYSKNIKNDRVEAPVPGENWNINKKYQRPEHSGKLGLAKPHGKAAKSLLPLSLAICRSVLGFLRLHQDSLITIGQPITLLISYFMVLWKHWLHLHFKFCKKIGHSTFSLSMGQTLEFPFCLLWLM